MCKKENRFILILLCVFALLPITAHAQISLKSEYLVNSGYSQENGDMHGSQAVSVQRLNANFPVAVKVKDGKLKYMWRVGVSGVFADGSSVSSGSTALFNQVKNGNLNATYMRPINKKWMMVSGVSVGVATDQGLSEHRVNHSAYCSFGYKFKNGINLSLGGALTDHFGTTMLFPMVMFNWEQDYKPYFFRLKSMYNLDATFGYHVHPRVDLTAVLNNNKISYLDKHEEDHKKTIFSYSYTVFGIQPVFKLPRNLDLSLCMGYAVNKQAQVKYRKLSQIFKNMTEYDVDSGAYLSVGLTWNMGRGRRKK